MVYHAHKSDVLALALVHPLTLIDTLVSIDVFKRGLALSRCSIAGGALGLAVLATF